jgi:hypothetical protein
MYFQWSFREGTFVLKTAAIGAVASVAARYMLEASGDSGAGASANSNALVNVISPAKLAKTRNVRRFFFTSSACP